MRFRLNISYEEVTEIEISKFSGVGLFRSEHIMSILNEYINQQNCIAEIKIRLNFLSKLFPNEEIWYRTFDMTSTQIEKLNGFNYTIMEKENMFGTRGIRHSLKFVDYFKFELLHLLSVMHNNQNVHLIFPFISTTKELEKCIEIINEINIKSKYGIMGEIPSTLLCIEDYFSLGISNLTIGINDLTSCLLGTNRNSYHNICDKSVLKILKSTIEKCKKNCIPVSVAGNMNLDFVKYMLEYDPDYLIIQPNDIKLINALSHNMGLAKVGLLY